MGDRKRLSDQLAAARQRIAELEEKLTRLSQRDPLIPSLLSLSAFRTQLDLDVARAHRYERPLTVALLDIDRFRHLNLEHGYAAGDAVLAAVGRLIAERTRVHDLACRMGGDEFGFLLPETGAAAATGAIERILVELEDLEAGGIRGVSASVGIAALELGAEARVGARRGAARRWSRRGRAVAGRPWCSAAPRRRARRCSSSGMAT